MFYYYIIMAGINYGSSNRGLYDSCAYQQDLYESTSPLQYNLYTGYGENCSRCIYDRYYVKYQLVDVESELSNRTRPLSRCNQFKYNKDCPKSKLCTSTFDRSVPVTLPPEICPIVYNNIPKMTHPGYTIPDMRLCN